jgi:hypothetical protein
LIVKRSAQEILYGYLSSNPDPLLLISVINPTTGIANPEAYAYNGIFSSWDSEEEAWSSTHQGQYAIYTGAGGHLKLVRQYYAWRGIPKFDNIYPDMWPIPLRDEVDRNDFRPVIKPSVCFLFDRTPADCSIWDDTEVITGANAGDYTAPFKEGNPNKISYAFSSEAYRSVRFMLAKKQDVKGIHAHRYYADKFHLPNSDWTYPEVRKTVDGVDVDTNARWRHDGPNGTLPMYRISPAPVYLSRPRGWMMDPHMVDAYQMQLFEDDVWVNITQPEDDFETTHHDEIDIFIDIEPLSGATMRGSKCLQVNVRLARNTIDGPFHSKFWEAFEGYDEIMWPILWAQQFGIIKNNDAEDFKDAIYGNRDLADKVAISGLAIGIFLVLVSIACIVTYARKGGATTTDGMKRMETNA